MNKIYIIIVTLIVIILGFFVYNKMSYLNIVVKFDDLEPFDKKMNVYYKGFKIGKTTKIYPDTDYKNTYINLKIHPHDIKLPDNITARIKSNKTTRYINILYPDSPSLTRIKNDDVIHGSVVKDLDSLLNEDGVGEIISDAASLMESATQATQSLNAIFVQVNEIISDMRKDILLTASNLAKTSSNLEKMSASLNASISEDQLKSSVDNIEKTTENIKEITGQIDKTTIPMVNSAMCNVKETTKNINIISGGIKRTLQKKMGLGRLLFGRPVDNQCN